MHFQEVHHNVWDCDAASRPVLADIACRGRPRKVLMHPGKTGFLYILDRTTGKPLIGVEEKPVGQEARIKTARTQPFPIGDRFVPLCAEPLGDYEQGCLFTPFWEKPADLSRQFGGQCVGADDIQSADQPGVCPRHVMSTVYSSKHDEFDEATGSFHGESDGNLVAYDIRTGEELWKFQTVAGANGPVSTFEADGEQYVAGMVVPNTRR